MRCMATLALEAGEVANCVDWTSDERVRGVVDTVAGLRVARGWAVAEAVAVDDNHLSLHLHSCSNWYWSPKWQKHFP